MELEQEIQIQLDSNPLLEKVEEQSSVESLSTLEEQERDQKDLTKELNADHLPNDLPVDTDWDDVYTHLPTSLGAAEYEEREDNRQGHLGLKEHMMQQINLLHFLKSSSSLPTVLLMLWMTMVSWIVKYLKSLHLCNIY